MIVVYGLTCDWKWNNAANISSKQAREQELRGIALKSRNSPVFAVHVRCNTENSKNMTRNILRRVMYPKRPLPETRFTTIIREEVCRALKNGERVILVGHSYGGSVAVRVGENIARCGDGVGLDRLEIATFGPIYMRSPRAFPPEIHIRQYTYKKDIAGACHRRKLGACEFATVLPNTGKNPLEAHMDYGSYINRIARTGSVDIDPTTTLP